VFDFFVWTSPTIGLMILTGFDGKISNKGGFLNEVMNMEHKGTVKGNVIELDEPLPFTDGTRVEVKVALESKPRKGSPKAILQLAGTLTYEESEAILKTAQECRRIDWELWEQKR